MRNVYDAKDDAYKTPILTYNRELDVIVLTNSITKSDLKEESSSPYLEDVVMNSKEKTTNLENTTLVATPQSIMGYNELNDPPMALGSIQYGNASKISNDYKTS